MTLLRETEPLSVWNVSLIRSSQIVHYWIDDTGSRALLLAEDDANVYRVVLDDENWLQRALTLSRFEWRDQRRLDLVEVANGVLIVNEVGVALIDFGGSLMWKVDHDQRIDWFFEKAEHRVVWYSSEYDGKWGYRLSDGARVDVSGSGPPAT